MASKRSPPAERSTVSRNNLSGLPIGTNSTTTCEQKLTKINVSHRFFAVGQGLFAGGSIELWPPQQKRRRQVEIEGPAAIPSPKAYHWTYDCGSSTGKRLVNSAIRKVKGGCAGQKLDLLTISHFHNDHISGVVDLIKEVGAKTVMLPWAPLWHRLLIGFGQGLQPEDAEMQFFLDPVRYLLQEAGDGFERVLFVMPSDSGGPPYTTDPDGAPDPSPDPEDYDKLSGPGDPVDQVGGLDLSHYHSTQRVRVLRPGKIIPVLGVWEFIPFNDPCTRPSDPRGFEAIVATHRRSLLSDDKRQMKAALQRLRAFYETTFGRKRVNDVSLMLYGGAIGLWHGHQYGECRPYCFLGQCDLLDIGQTNAAILLTGDGNLSNPRNWATLESYLDSRRAVGTVLFQVPHHGSRSNWHDGLAASISPNLSIFSSDPDHSYGHPHAEVLRDFWKYGVAQVDQNHSFSMRILLDR